LIDLPPGSTVNYWQTSSTAVARISAGLIGGPPTDPTQTDVIKFRNGGYFDLTANVTTPCGTFNIVKTHILAGPPLPSIGGPYVGGSAPPAAPGPWISFDPEYAHQQYEYDAVGNGSTAYPPTGYSWTVIPPSGSGLSAYTTTGNQLVYTYDVSGNYTLQLFMSTASCGTGVYSKIVGVNPGYYRVSATPNPSVSFVDVTMEDIRKKGEISSANIQAVRLVNKAGVMVHYESFKTPQSKVRINVNKLANDLYFLQVYDGKTWTKSNVLIQH
jgi:hypothetical protein